MTDLSNLDELAPNAAWLKEARAGSKMTQAMAARASGVSVETIRAIEQGRSPGSPHTLGRLADALEVDPPPGAVRILAARPIESGISGARHAMRDAIVDLIADAHLDDLAALLVAAAWITERRSRQDPATGRLVEAHASMPDLVEFLDPHLSPEAAIRLVERVGPGSES